jgi:hypothetical protein
MAFQHLEANNNTNKGRLLVALLAAFALTSIICAAYFILRSRYLSNQPQEAAAKPTPVPQAEVHLFEDEARLRGNNALISGTVQNRSTQPLDNLQAVIELTVRNNSKQKEQRVLPVSPSQLAPNQQGAYQLLVPSARFSALKVIAVRSGDRNLCQPALQPCSSAGKLRPKDIVPDPKPKIVIRQVPPTKRNPPKGDTVINTPETADPY